MYKVVGADKNEYGPAGPDQIEEWIKQRRLNGQSLAKAEGTDSWRPLSEFSEFESALAQSGPATEQPPSLPAPVYLPASPRTNVMAVLGLIMGLLSLTISCCCYGLPFNVLGLVFSLVALHQIKQDPDRETGRGMALAGLILCLLSLLVAACLLLLGLAQHNKIFFGGGEP